MNDPNGLVYYNGKYHLFFQHNPFGMQAGNNSWGHAVSTDLISWEEKPLAIPMKNGVKIFSGSVVVDWKNTSGFGINGKPPLVAIYTGKTTIEDQRIAYSNDEGLTWTNYNANPVLTRNNNQFRDPKVTWHEETHKWIMTVAVPAYQGISFYSSPDLKNWIPISGFGGQGNTTAMWECPDLLQLPADKDSNNKKWALVHSVAPSAQYFIGNFNGQQFSWDNSSVPAATVIEDFENDNYSKWQVTGNCFGTGPATGTSTFYGYVGTKMLRSGINGNSPMGKMVSTDFIIQKKFISFLVSGGYDMQRLRVSLIIDGESKAISTGMNELIMKWRNWDVSALVGRTAHIEIVDSTSWSSINIDHIIQSDKINDFVNTGQIDYGKDFYAVQSFSDVPNGRKIWLAWLGNWSYGEAAPTTPWKGIMTTPREVTLETHNGILRLVQKPVEELKSLRKTNISFRNKTVNSINTALNENMLNSIQSNTSFKQFELKAKMSVRHKSGFSFKFKKGAAQYTEFIFDFVNKQIRFDRSKSGALTTDGNFRQLQFAPLIIENDSIDIHLFVDNSSVELFASNGQVVMSNQIFPDSTSNRIELASLDEDFVIEEFDIWRFQKAAVFTGPPIDKFPLFKIYPNPVVNGNGVTIKVKDELAGKVDFKIFDATGKMLSGFAFESNSIILPRNKLPLNKGLYFLHASYGHISQTEKIILLDH